MKKECKTKNVVKFASLFFLAFLVSLNVQADPLKSGKMPFIQLDQSASFIYGDNLITDAMPESDVRSESVAKETLKMKAEGLSAMMVTPNGDMFESKMTENDAEIFLKAIEKLEKAGFSASVFTQKNVHPKDLSAIFKSKHRSDDVHLNVVIGTDNRTRITNTVTSPNWFIGRIAVGCTGTLISEKHVLTAGHCVADGRGHWYSNLNFTVAKNGSYEPWGSEVWTRAITTSAWFNDRNSNYDYGMIVLRDQPHGGHAGWGVYSGGTHRITGYPGDKPFGTMWTHSGATWTSGSYRLCYYIDTAGGQSGSGIADTSGYVRGVHTTGSSLGNCGTRMTSTVFNTLKNWISTYPN